MSFLCRCGNAIDPSVHFWICPACVEKWKERRDKAATELRDRPWKALANALTRARQKNLPSTLTLDEWRVIYDAHGGRCHYCHENPAEIIEHMIPEIRGGGTTKENVTTACFPCNMSKGSKTPEEWKGR